MNENYMFGFTRILLEILNSVQIYNNCINVLYISMFICFYK